MNEDIKRSVEQLDQALSQPSTLDSEQQQHLTALASDLRSASSADHSSLMARVDRMLVLFGDDHPDIAAALRTVLDTLARSGV